MEKDFQKYYAFKHSNDFCRLIYYHAYDFCVHGGDDDDVDADVGVAHHYDLSHHRRHLFPVAHPFHDDDGYDDDDPFPFLSLSVWPYLRW